MIQHYTKCKWIHLCYLDNISCVWICATVTDRRIQKHFVFWSICNRNNNNVFSKTILFIKLHFVILFLVQSQHPFCWFNSNNYITLVRWILIEWYLWRIEMIWAIQQFLSFFCQTLIQSSELCIKYASIRCIFHNISFIAIHCIFKSNEQWKNYTELCIKIATRSSRKCCSFEQVYGLSWWE